MTTTEWSALILILATCAGGIGIVALIHWAESHREKAAADAKAVADSYDKAQAARTKPAPLRMAPIPPAPPRPHVRAVGRDGQRG